MARCGGQGPGAGFLAGVFIRPVWTGDDTGDAGDDLVTAH